MTLNSTHTGCFGSYSPQGMMALMSGAGGAFPQLMSGGEQCAEQIEAVRADDLETSGNKLEKKDSDVTAIKKYGSCLQIHHVCDRWECKMTRMLPKIPCI